MATLIVSVSMCIRQFLEARDLILLAAGTSPSIDALTVASMAPEYFLAISPSRWAEAPSVIAGASVVGALLSALIGARFSEGVALRSDLHTLARDGRGLWTATSVLMVEACTGAAIAVLAGSWWVASNVAATRLDAHVDGMLPLLRGADQVDAVALPIAWLAASVPAACAFALGILTRSPAAGVALTTGLWLLQALALPSLPSGPASWLPFALQTTALRGAIPDAVPVTIVSMIDVPATGLTTPEACAALGALAALLFGCAALAVNRRDL